MKLVVFVATGALVGISSSSFPGNHHHVAGTAGGNILAAPIPSLMLNTEDSGFPLSCEFMARDRPGSIACDKVTE